MKWIRAIELEKGSATAKTKRWRIETKPDAGPKDPEWAMPEGTPLGLVKWHPAWRRYTFWPGQGCLFESACLRDIADFCDEQTKTRKAERSEELKAMVPSKVRWSDDGGRSGEP